MEPSAGSSACCARSPPPVRSAQAWPPAAGPLHILVAGGVGATIRRAATLADGWFVSSIVPLPRLAELDALAPGARVACNRLAVVAETDEEAAGLADAYVRPVLAGYGSAGD